MSNTKVFGIESDNFYEFIKKINEFYSKQKVFATQCFYENNKWFAVIYFESNNQPVPQAKSGDKNQGKSFVKGKHPFDNSGKGNMPSFPSPDNIPPTPSQASLLLSLGKKVPNTKREAWQMINSIKNEKGGY